jgi:hypothetical protein
MQVALIFCPRICQDDLYLHVEKNRKRSPADEIFWQAGD